MGCAATTTHKLDAPEWYLRPPTSPDTFYGVGEGVSGREARKSARIALAGQLRVHVQSELKMLEQQDGDFYSVYIRDETEQTISGVAMLGATAVRQEQRGRSFFALMKLEKRSVLLQHKAELEADAAKVRRAVRADGQTGFDRWWRLVQARPDAQRLVANITLLSTLDAGPFERERALLSRYRAELDRTLRTRSLRMMDRTRIAGLAELMRELLQKSDIKASSGGRSATLELETEHRTQRLAGEFYVDATLWVRLRSASGSVLSQFSIEKSGVALRDARVARNRANKALYGELKKIGVIERLIESAAGSA